MITKHLTSAIIAGVVIASISGFTFADAAEDKGLAIAQQMKTRDAGWIDMTASMNMVLRNKNGLRIYMTTPIRIME